MAAEDPFSLDSLTKPIQELFIPPASSAYRNYRYPGFFTGGTPSVTPNPVAGDNPVAAPSAGEYSYVPPAPEAQQSGLFAITANPYGKDGGTSADERAANRAKDVGDAGEVTAPGDALRALSLAASIGPTGIATLAGRTALNQLGAPDAVTDPVGAIFGDAVGNPFDLKSNTNRRPGWRGTYDAAIAKGLSPQAALNAARGATDPGSNTWGNKGTGTTQPRDATTPSAPSGPTDVTAANAQTGFGAQPAAAAKAASAPAAASPGAGANVGAGAAPAPATAAPAAATVSAPAATLGRPSGYGGGAGASGSGGGGRGSDSWGDRSRGGTESRDPGSEGKFSKGGKVTNGSQAFRNATCYNDGGAVMSDPETSMQYNPPAEMTEGEGDTEPAMLTPGEFVVTKGAAQQYDPQVLAALNDPEMAAKINEIIEDLLGDDAEEDAEEGETDDAGENDNESDDGHGLGVMDLTSKPRVGALHRLTRVA